MDPLADKYPGWSPYNYALNNPLRFIDPNGMEALDVYPDDPDDPEKNIKQHPFYKNKVQESKNITGEEIKVGNKSAGEIIANVSERSSKLISAVDYNMPTILDGTALVLLPVVPSLSALLSTVSTAWTVKNDTKTGDFTNTKVSMGTQAISFVTKSPNIKFGVQAYQVLYDVNGPIDNTIRESLIKEIRGNKNQLEEYKKFGNYGY